LPFPLENVLLGLKVGHHSTFQLAPGQAFGPRNPDLIQRVSLATLRENSELDHAVLEARDAGRKYITVASKVLSGK